MHRVISDENQTAKDEQFNSLKKTRSATRARKLSQQGFTMKDEGMSLFISKSNNTKIFNRSLL